jgi:folate-dependent phosphoribosylglycinamide formyltransferase PurN
MSPPIRIVFVTPEEPAVMPLFFERALPQLRGDVAAIAVVSPVYQRSSWIRQARQFVAAFGLRDFAVEAGHYAVAKLRPRRSVKAIAQAHGIPLLTPHDVNSADFLDALRARAPDLVISVACPQIFGAELLELPRLGCVNVHSALLPNYRGVLPTFWVLANNEHETGVTVHRMAEDLDSGEILVQRRVPITPDETLHSLMRRCKLVAAEAVLEAVTRFRSHRVEEFPNPAGEGSYYSFPARSDVLRFRALGRALR